MTFTPFTIAVSAFSGVLGAIAAFVYLWYRMRQNSTLRTNEAIPYQELTTLVRSELSGFAAGLETNVGLLMDSLENRLSVSFLKELHQLRKELHQLQESGLTSIHNELKALREADHAISERVSRIETIINQNERL